MKMTNLEIITRHKVLLAVGKYQLPRKLSYAIARNAVTLEQELKLITAQAQDIAERYAKKDENGEFVRTQDGGYTFASKENATAYRTECKELEAEEVEVRIRRAAASELDKCEEDGRFTVLTPAQEVSIAWMLDYGDDEEVV